MGREARSGDDDPGHPAGRLSIIALAGSVAVYALFAGTSPGRRADAEVLYRDLDWTWEWPARALATTVWPPLIVLAVLGLCWIALRDRRPADALRAVVLVAATLVLSRLVEEALKTLDPIGVEKARALGPGWYPSGHAAAAMSLGLAALLVSPPRLRTRALLLAAGVWPAMVGWAILADAGHHPTMWSAASCWRPRSQARSPSAAALACRRSACCPGAPLT